jgi:hypothetical protein
LLEEVGRGEEVFLAVGGASAEGDDGGVFEEEEVFVAAFEGLGVELLLELPCLAVGN